MPDYLTKKERELIDEFPPERIKKIPRGVSGEYRFSNAYSGATTSQRVKKRMEVSQRYNRIVSLWEKGTRVHSVLAAMLDISSSQIGQDIKFLKMTGRIEEK